MDSSVTVMGDVHGHYRQLVDLLQGAELIDGTLAWVGGQRVLWFMGDFLDNGPDSLPVVDLVMRLQTEAAALGGRVRALLGNHEVMFLTTCDMGDTRFPGRPHITFREALLGGARAVSADLDDITPAQIAWLRALPAMALVNDHLLVHADSALYIRYGDSVEGVNRAFASIMHSPDPAGRADLWLAFSDRYEFSETWQPGGADRARAFLARYGGQRIVHGHTPIYTLTGRNPGQTTEALVYADGLCVDVDAGLYMGAPGFLYTLPDR